jgi:hypothetical protein
MADNITGSVVGKIRFNIDKRSWDNLALFQNKLTSVKKQLGGLDKAIKVQATINNINKVANATVNAEKKVARVRAEVAKKHKLMTFGSVGGDPKGYVKFWQTELKAQEKIQNEMAKQSQKAIRTANGKANLTERLSHLFPTLAITSAANKTYYAQLMREEEAASEKAASEYDRRRERLLNQRAKQNAARAKRKAKEAAAISRASSAQEAFGIRADFHVQRKEGQFRNYAERFGLKSEQIEAGLTKIREQAAQSRKMYTGANITDLEGFKKDLNMATNALLTQQRALRANAITFASLRSELVQLTAAYTAFSAIQNIAQTGFEMEGLRASAKVFAKDEAGVADHMKFIRDEAMRLGVDLQLATKEFTKFSIATKTTMTKDQQRSLFTGVSEYAQVLGTSKEDYQRALRALQQIECCLPTQ